MDRAFVRGPDHGFQKIIGVLHPTNSPTKNISICDDYFLGLENKLIGIINVKIMYLIYVVK